MVQILKNPYSDIGRNLGSGLQALAQHKIGQLHMQQQQQRAAQGIRALLPQLSEQQAYSFSQQSPEIQKIYLKNALDTPQNQAYARALGLTNESQQSQLMPEQEPAPQDQQPRNPFEYASEPVVALSQHAVPKLPVNKEPLPALNAKQATEVAKLRQKEKVALKAEEAAKFKETKDARKDLANKSKVAKRRLEDLERIEELEREEGGLNTPGYVEFLKRSGLDIPSLLNPSSEELQKLTQTFLGGAKEAFGGMVSNYEVEQFLKTIPSLSQSPEGRKRVIANMKRIYRSDIAYNDAKKEIIRENKGIPPYDLEDQIDDRIGKKEEGIAKQFKQDLLRPVPAGQNKFITALQSAAGSVAGNAGKIAKGAAGAALGSRIGSAVGPYGSAAGGLLGGLGGLSGLI